MAQPSAQAKRTACLLIFYMPRQDAICCAGTLRKEDVWTQSRHSLEDAIKTEQQQGAVSEQMSDEERLRERLDNLKLVMHVMGSDGACLVSGCALWCTTPMQWRLLGEGCCRQWLWTFFRSAKALAAPIPPDEGGCWPRTGPRSSCVS